MNRDRADCWLRSFPCFWQHHLEQASWPRKEEEEEEKLPRLLQLVQPRVSGCLFVCCFLCWSLSRQPCYIAAVAVEGFLSQDVDLGTLLKNRHLTFPNFFVPLTLNLGWFGCNCVSSGQFGLWVLYE